MAWTTQICIACIVRFFALIVGGVSKNAFQTSSIALCLACARKLGDWATVSVSTLCVQIYFTLILKMSSSSVFVSGNWWLNSEEDQQRSILAPVWLRECPSLAEEGFQRFSTIQLQAVSSTGEPIAYLAHGYWDCKGSCCCSRQEFP